MSIRNTALMLSVAVVAIGCRTSTDTDWQQAIAEPGRMHQQMKLLTDVMVDDIFSPPHASRTYAYPAIAAYEAMRPGYDGYQTLAGQLNDLTPIPAPDAEATYAYEVAGLTAFLRVAQALVFSENRVGEYTAERQAEWATAGVPDDVLARSVAYGETVAQHVLAWADGDMYKETRSYPKYNVTDAPGRWQPTPPGYMDSIEPHWNKIRPFVLDSANQFVPLPPTPFDVSATSQFMQEAKEVAEVGNALTEEQREIASFWDCNPYVLHTRGHVMYASKKLTPGGHWMGITGLATRKVDADIIEVTASYARVAIALADAFISSWDEKYRSNLIRPETVINQYIDKSWEPLLQTPPFPEHTSGHSVISTAAAVTLTDMYGDTFAFADSTEVEYGLPVRHFDSFMDAAQEAAISRLYGGIHYRPAIDYGVDQGRDVGEWVVQHVSLRPAQAAINAEE